MPFLFPALLWLLPLAAIPVLLHLLTLHRLKTVELSTYRFLFDSYIQQRRRMQFLEALLAVLRTLFLLFVVLMIAGPGPDVHPSSAFGGGSGGRRRRPAGRLLRQHERPQRRPLRLRPGAAPPRSSSPKTSAPRTRSRSSRSAPGRTNVFSRFSPTPRTSKKRSTACKTTSSRGNVFAALHAPVRPRRTEAHQPTRLPLHRLPGQRLARGEEPGARRTSSPTRRHSSSSTSARRTTCPTGP